MKKSSDAFLDCHDQRDNSPRITKNIHFFALFYYVSHRIWLGVRRRTRLSSFSFIFRLTAAAYQTADGDYVFTACICSPPAVLKIADGDVLRRLLAVCQKAGSENLCLFYL